VELHGFLSHLVKAALTGGKYSVFGYKGKQVRDNIHSHDVVRAIEEFAANPRPGDVYNLGGGRANSISMLEAIERIEQRNHFLAAWTVSENVVTLSQEAHVYLSCRQTQLFLQTSALPPRDVLQVFLQTAGVLNGVNGRGNRCRRHFGPGWLERIDLDCGEHSIPQSQNWIFNQS
jgi:dTDP-D-glucose 4,6-dehydratase